jgi:hypothetical protein
MIMCEAPATGPVCDFCLNPHPAYAYPAGLIEMRAEGAPIGAASSDAWAACKACHDLIEKDDRGALAERAVTLLEFPPAFMTCMRELHEAFFLVRKGPPIVLLPGMERGI